MDNSYNPSSHLPGHLGMRPNDQFLRQTPTLSPNILLRFPTPPAPIPYNNTPMNSQWPNSMSSNKLWWQSVGPYDPYRTTYQDYGPPKHQFFPTPNLYHIQPTIYNQDFNMNPGNRNPSGAMSHPANSPIPYPVNSSISSPVNNSMFYSSPRISPHM